MREILFRGKNVDNGAWVYGSFIPDMLEVFCITDIDGFIKPFSLNKEELTEVRVERSTVGQFTGLTDKNGTKIFEGDILRLWGDGYDWNGIVVFGRTTSDEDNLEDYGYGWQLDKITKDEPVYTKILLWVEADGIDCEIIGNAHDNPELLKE